MTAELDERTIAVASSFFSKLYDCVSQECGFRIPFRNVLKTAVEVMKGDLTLFDTPSEMVAIAERENGGFLTEEARESIIRIGTEGRSERIAEHRECARAFLALVAELMDDIPNL